MKSPAHALQSQTAPDQSNVAPPVALLLGKPIESAINALVYTHPRTGLLAHVNSITDDLECTSRFYAELLDLERRDGPPPLTPLTAQSIPATRPGRFAMSHSIVQVGITS
jgi:hypothetical protein